MSDSLVLMLFVLWITTHYGRVNCLCHFKRKYVVITNKCRKFTISHRLVDPLRYGLHRWSYCNLVVIKDFPFSLKIGCLDRKHFAASWDLKISSLDVLWCILIWWAFGSSQATAALDQLQECGYVPTLVLFHCMFPMLNKLSIKVKIALAGSIWMLRYL